MIPPDLVTIGDSGRAARELGARLPPAGVEPADHALSEYATDDLEIRAASIRGLMHRYREEPRQDSFCVVHDPQTETTVVVVCDGVGSKPLSHHAADFVCRRLPGHYFEHRDWSIAIKQVNDELLAYAQRGPAPEPEPGAEPETETETETEEGHRSVDMATTVVAVAISGPPEARTVRLGWTDDSTVWRLTPDSRWQVLAAPPDEEGEIHTGSVQALPSSSPRLLVDAVPFTDGAVFVMTDGVGMPLANSVQVQAALASWWARPPAVFEFGRQVGFARRGHLDDRTVVGIWIRVPEQGENR